MTQSTDELEILPFDDQQPAEIESNFQARYQVGIFKQGVLQKNAATISFKADTNDGKVTAHQNEVPVDASSGAADFLLTGTGTGHSSTLTFSAPGCKPLSVSMPVVLELQTLKIVPDTQKIPMTPGGKTSFDVHYSCHVGSYGLVGTCRLNGIEPETYLRHILSVLSEWPSNKVAELLPWNVVLTDK